MNGKKSPLKISTLKGVLKCHSGNTMPREFPSALWRLTSNHKIISWTEMCWGATVAESGGAHMRAVDCPTQKDSTAGKYRDMTPSWKDLRINSWRNNTFIKTKNLSHVYPFIQESLFKHLWYAKHQAWAGEEKLNKSWPLSMSVKVWLKDTDVSITRAIMCLQCTRSILVMGRGPRKERFTDRNGPDLCSRKALSHSQAPAARATKQEQRIQSRPGLPYQSPQQPGSPPRNPTHQAGQGRILKLK